MIAFFTTIGFGASLSLLRVGGPQVVRVLPVLDGRRRGAERRRAGTRGGARPASADGRAGRIGDADRRTGDGPGVRAAVRAGRRARRRDAGGRGGDGRHRRGRTDGRPDRDVPGRAVGCWRSGKAPRRARRIRTAPSSPRTSSRTCCTNPRRSAPAGEDVEAYGLLKALVVILVAMWIGGWVSRGFTAIGAHAAGLHRRHAGRRGDPQLDDVTGCSGCRRSCSTISAASRCRCSSCSR